jgi:hypothetical protein
MIQLAQDLFYICIAILICIGFYVIFLKDSNTIEISPMLEQYEALKIEALLINTSIEYDWFMEKWQVFNDKYFDKRGYFEMALEIHEIIEVKRMELQYSKRKTND